MRTHRERDIAKMDDKTLMNYIYSHLDRAQDRNTGAQNNLLISSFPTLSEEKKEEKLTAVGGYLIQLGDDLTALRLASKNFHKRLLRTKRQVHNMRVQFEKARGERAPTIEDVAMPDLWNVGEFAVTHKTRIASDTEG